MDGAALIGIGLSVIGASAPVTAAIITRKKRAEGNGRVEEPCDPACKTRVGEHGEHLQRLDSDQRWLRETISRIDKRTERIERALGAP